MLNLQQEKIACIGKKGVINQGDQKQKKIPFWKFFNPQTYKEGVEKVWSACREANLDNCVTNNP